MSIKIFTLIIFILPFRGLAQYPILEKVINANGLICFPVLGDSNRYVYLPKDVKFSLDKNNQPQFSFLRYVKERKDNSKDNITQATGGAILNFIIEYATDENTKDGAQRRIREITKNNKATLQGQVIFDMASYTLISSILDDNGQDKKKMVASGKAPIFENTKMGFSFELKPEQSTVLLNSLQMNNPDVSIAFELGFSGIGSEYDAEITVNWEEVNKYKEFSSSGRYYFISGEVDISIKELVKNNSIAIRSVGNNAKMEALVESAYTRIVNLLYSPVVNAKSPELSSEKEENEVISKLLSSSLKSAKIISAHAKFEYKKNTNKGISKINFSGQQVIQRYYTMVFNIGHIYIQYGRDKQFFKDVALLMKPFQQRKIHLSIDGNLENCYQTMLNGISIKLKKVYPIHEPIIKELFFNNNAPIDSIQNTTISYLYLDEEDEEDWLKYQYQINYFFKGGKSFVSPWDTTNASLISIFPPFENRKIELAANVLSLPGANNKILNIKIYYPFFGFVNKEELNIKEGDDLRSKYFQITTPLNSPEYEYEITYFDIVGNRKKVKRKETTNIIFIE